jgi:pyruvate kinase
MSLKTSAIISVTKSGSTARMISRFRPACPIIGVTTTHKVLRQLSLSWGVYPMLSPELHTTDDLFSMGIEKALESGLVKHGDVVVITAGIPVGISGTTNLLKVQVAGNALIRGYGIGNETVTGEVCVAKNAEEACDRFNDGDILVMPSSNNDVLQLMKKAKAIIVEDDEASGHAATVAQALDIAVILGAANATDIMKTGTVVAVDPVNGLVIVPD